MAVDKRLIQQYIKRYNEVTGQSVTSFVCPFSLRECPDSELIDGHVLNRGFSRASRVTVVQHSRIDHWYGSRVEAHTIDVMNQSTFSPVELVRFSEDLELTFPDGRRFRAFFAESPAGRKAEGRFPKMELRYSGEFIGNVFVKSDDAAIVSCEPIGMTAGYAFRPFDHIAAFVKASYLTLFRLMGYEAVLRAIARR